MIIKNLIDEDFSNYKECAMFIGFPHCTFKCERECGCTGMCQNSNLVKSPDIEIPVSSLVNRYLTNPLSGAIVCGGLEPLDSWEDVLALVRQLRETSSDTVIIYTGYKYEEVVDIVMKFKQYENIIFKFGRFVPNQEKHFDEVLGVYLASNNQYAEKVS